MRFFVRATARVTRPSSRAVPGLGALRVVLVALTASLWVSLLFLLRLEARNRLAGSPGESSPLYLAIVGLPSVLLVTACTVAAATALRRERCGADGSRPLALCSTLLLVGGVGLVAVPWYSGAVWEFASLPWKALAH